MTIEQTHTRKRQYRRITPDVKARFKALEIIHGNGAQAVIELEHDTRLSPRSRAFRIRAKQNNENAVEFIDTQLQQIGIDAVQRVGKMVNSVDEGIATRNTHFVIDHLRGKAVQKSVNLTAKVNIQSVLD